VAIKLQLTNISYHITDPAHPCLSILYGKWDTIWLQCELRDEDSCLLGCDTASGSQIKTALLLGLPGPEDEIKKKLPNGDNYSPKDKESHSRKSCIFSNMTVRTSSLAVNFLESGNFVSNSVYECR
jgi:hypothetical protein